MYKLTLTALAALAIGAGSLKAQQTITATQIGRHTIYSNGVSATQIGRSTVYSNGATATQIGRTTVYSNVPTCPPPQHYGCRW